MPKIESTNKKSGDSQTKFLLFPEKLFTPFHHKKYKEWFKAAAQHKAINCFANILVYFQSIDLDP